MAGIGYDVDRLRGLPAVRPHPMLGSTAGTLELSFASMDLGDQREALENTVRALENLPFGPDDDTAIVLRAFLFWLPQDGQATLVSEIKYLLPDVTKLRELRNFLVDTILIPMKLSGWENTETWVYHLDEMEDYGMITIASHTEQRALTSDCLMRDGCRCFMTRAADIDSISGRDFWERNAWLWDHDGNEIRDPPNIQPAYEKGERRPAPTFLECVHIIPLGLGRCSEGDTEEAQTKAAIWWALHRYFPALAGKIDASTINQRENAVMMGSNVRHGFLDLDLALQPTDIPNQYEIRTFALDLLSLLYSLQGVSSTVKVASHYPWVPMPRPEFFDARYRIGAILHNSGIRKKINSALAFDEEEPHTYFTVGRESGEIYSRAMLTDL